MMKRYAAHLLRRLANKLDPRATQAAPQVFMTYNGQPVDMEKVVVTTLAKLQRQRRI